MVGRALLLRAEPGFSLPAFERAAPPPPPALVDARLDAGSAPGDIVLDPFGRGGWVARAAIDRQRKAVSLESGALDRLLAEVVLRPPDLRHLDAAIQALAASARRETSLKASIADRYASRCATCDRPIVLDEVTWAVESTDEDGRPAGPRPIRKHYRCPVCRDQLGGGEPAPGARSMPPDVERAVDTEGSEIRDRLLDRFPVLEGGELLGHELLDLHTTRQLAALGGDPRADRGRPACRVHRRGPAPRLASRHRSGQPPLDLGRARGPAADRQRPRQAPGRCHVAGAQPVARVRGWRPRGARLRPAPGERRLGPGPGSPRR